MTATRPESFGPYTFTLAPAEAEAAAARAGIRLALKGGLLARHLAPLTAFALIVTFASILALTGLVSRRAGEATILVAAAAFMIQRLVNHWLIRGARLRARKAIARLESAGPLKANFGDDALALDVDGRVERLLYADCDAAEDAGGLIYVWRHDGAPIVLPARALADADEAARLVVSVSDRIRSARGEAPKPR